jgi:Flp pilus assembly protein CpaB
MTYRVRNIAIAVALAAVAALLTSFYVTSYKRHVQRAEDHVTVLVAKQDIKQGTSGGDAAKLLTSMEVPRRSVVPGAVSEADQLSGLVATQKTLQGEQVTTRRFGTLSQLGVRAQLTGTLRAFQVFGDPTQLLAGTLKAGDHVDFVQSVDEDRLYARVFVRNLKVLQAPNAPATGTKLTSSVGAEFSVMLAMTDNQAQKIQWLLANSSSDQNTKPDRWHLALRPVVNDADSTDHVDTFYTVITDGLTPAEKRAFAFAQKKSPLRNR